MGIFLGGGGEVEENIKIISLVKFSHCNFTVTANKLISSYYHITYISVFILTFSPARLAGKI